MAPPNLVDSPKLREMTISKGIIRRARVRIFIIAYGSFWFQLSGISSNWTGHHETKSAKPIWSCRSKHSNLGYLLVWLTMTSWIDSTPSEPSNSIQSGHTGTNGASFPRTNISWKKDTDKLPIFGNFGRRYFHFCSSPGQKLGCYGIGSTSATGTIVGHFLRVYMNYSKLFKHKLCFCKILRIFTGTRVPTSILRV
jgi:hypothetical protein